MKNILYSFVVSVIVCNFSCTKYEEPIAIFENEIDTALVVKKKILLIAINGLSGNISKTIDLPVIESLKSKAIYSYDAISDIRTTDAASWTSLITGNGYSLHKTSDSSFIKDIDSKNVTESYNYIPDLYNIVASSGYNYLNTAIISNWSNLQKNLFFDAKKKVLINNDKAATDSTINLLKVGKSDLVVVNLNDPALAGRVYGFSGNVPEYVNAIKASDSYIGKMVNALAESPNKSSEDWLIIITGTHGGINKSYGGSSKEEISVFTLYNNNRLINSDVSIKNIDQLIEIRRSGKENTNCFAVPHEVDYMNLTSKEVGQTTQFWIKGKIEDIEALNSNASTIMSKMDDKRKPYFDASSRTIRPLTTGWELCFVPVELTGIFGVSTREQRFILALYDQMRNTYVELHLDAASKILDGNWHNIALVINDTMNTNPNRLYRVVKYYFDGKRRDITVSGIAYSVYFLADAEAKSDYSNNEPFLIGGERYGNKVIPPFKIKNFMLFKTGLNETEIASNFCISDIKSHPKSNYLKAFYKFDEGFGNEIVNQVSPGLGNLYVRGTSKWVGDRKELCNNSNAILTKKDFQMTNLDIVPNILYWYNIDTKAYSFTGNSWLSDFL